MGRFLPAQLVQWTGGDIIRNPQHEYNTDRFYRAISTDTRSIKEGEAFVALRGDHFDGHRFLDEAVKRGASVLVIEKDSPQAKIWQQKIQSDKSISSDLLLVDDTRKAYQDIAAGYRKMLPGSVVAVTGSVGKTTTRRMTHEMLQSQLRADQSEGNLNNEIGLSYTLLSTDSKTQVLVAELAMDRRGEIKQLSEIARPDISIITHIGFSHAEYVGSMRDILQEKTSIISGMKDNGLLLLNGDDQLLRDWAMDNDISVPIWFVSSKEHIGEIERAGFPVFWHEDSLLNKSGTSFIAYSNLAPEESWKISMPVFGEHYVNTALFGLATAYALGLDMDKAAAAASNFQNIDSRQQLIQIGNIAVLDDAYNASPESFVSALENVEVQANGRRRVLVFGGMRELGRYTKGVHESAARQIIASDFERVILIGKETKYTQELLLQYDRGEEIFAGWYETVDDALSRILDEVEDGDFVLLKASRYYHLERVMETLEKKFSLKNK